MEEAFFEKISGKQVFCIFSQPEPHAKKIVIMSHGFRGTNIGPARQFVDFQRILNKEGFSVLRFDQPNSGDSEGEYVESSFSEWVKTIVYLANKYLDLGYEVSLLGQSMGATATVVATSDPTIRDRIPCMFLWVPDAKGTIDVDPNETYEESGQKYKGNFWVEAKNSDFFRCLTDYKGKIHLVFGEADKYVKKELMEQTIETVKAKDQEVMVLKGQDHGSWKYDSCQKIYHEELRLLKHVC